MSMVESVAYLKGLAEGLDIDASKKEGKLLTAIIDVLGEMAASITDLEEVCDELDELVDIIDEDLGSVEEDLYCDDEDDDDDYEMEDDELYEVTCPNCNNVVYLDEEMIVSGEVDCPECGQKLEFDIDDCCCEGDDCDCDNHDCGCGCKD
ncbi:MAG: hypothetical protein RR444_04215 [Oscillospiraceae bacterium]